VPATAPRWLLAAAGIVVGLGAGTVAIASGQTDDHDHDDAVAYARLMDASGERVGRVEFRATHGRIVVSGRVAGVAPGFHGFHVHSVGACDPAAVDATGQPSPFFSAGGHLNPAGTDHGGHAGDMPPLLVLGDGTAYARYTTDRFDLGTLLDADGSAVIIHAAPDNLANIPSRYQSRESPAPGPDAPTLQTGDSGARHACGVIAER